MLRLSVTSRSSQHPQLGPNKKIKPTLNSQLRSYVNRGQGLSLSKCFVYPICIVRGTLLEPTGQPARRLSIYSFSQPAALSPTGPTSCSCQSQIIWHDILQASISNNQKHPTADPRYAPFPHVPAFEEPIGCYYGMIVIQHWMRQFDVGAEWCSLSHCGRGLEYRTQFQTHVSVIYRSVFHRRAVQGLRNACSVLPGLSACRLCLLFTSLWQTHTHTQAHWCMYECTHADLLGIRTSMCRHTHEDKPLSSITHHHDYPMITLRAQSSLASASAPWKTFAPLQWKARTLWIARWWWWWWWRWWGWWWWPHLLCLISLLSQTVLHKLPAGRTRLPAKLTCNLKQNIK